MSRQEVEGQYKNNGDREVYVVIEKSLTAESLSQHRNFMSQQ